MVCIFISYRTSLSPTIASLIHEHLESHFGRNGQVFFDTRTIKPGNAFPEDIQRALEFCEVFVVVIDKGWHEVAENGKLRLHQDNDWVRQEIATVLRRNKLTPPGEPEPVLILPILLGDAEMPKKEDVPEDLRPLCDKQGHKCSLDSRQLWADVDKLVDRIWEHLGEPFTGVFGARTLMSRADVERKGQFRLRAVRKREDLEPFVRLSEAEIDIVNAHKTLTTGDRWKLYENWCRWTATDDRLPWYDVKSFLSRCWNRWRRRSLLSADQLRWDNVKSFLSLERRSDNGVWEAIGVSIILRLSERGVASLAKGYLENPEEKLDAVKLMQEDLARVPSPGLPQEGGLEGQEPKKDDRAPGPLLFLLLDTWIIGQSGKVEVKIEEGKLEKRPKRHEHHNWGICFILRHLAEFWDPDFLQGRWIPEATILVEPDSPKITRMLNGLGFVKGDRTGSEILIFRSTVDRWVDPDLGRNVDKVVKNLKWCKANLDISNI